MENDILFNTKIQRHLFQRRKHRSLSYYMEKNWKFIFPKIFPYLKI